MSIRFNVMSIPMFQATLHRHSLCRKLALAFHLSAVMSSFSAVLSQSSIRPGRRSYAMAEDSV